MEQTGTDVARVHLERFCIRCGRYDLRVELPEPETAPASDRERWMAGPRSSIFRNSMWLEFWRRWADDVSGEAVAGGHFFAEEDPVNTADRLRNFLLGHSSRPDVSPSRANNDWKTL